MSGNSPTRRLPAQPSLEQLRNQAKDLLHDYRAGVAAAANEIARFERHADPSTFALNDAQRVLARAYGFESWPKLKAFVDGITVRRFAEAVKASDLDRVRAMLDARPELANTDMAKNDEHRGLHYAVYRRDARMVKLLMEAGADARKGIWPHRDATSALTLARDRGYDDVVAVIEEQETLRRARLSCPNAMISPAQDQISAAIRRGDRAEAIRLLSTDETLVRACDRNGRTPLHIAAGICDEEMIEWLLARRADPRKQDAKGLTPLDLAALAAGGNVAQRRIDPYDEYADRFPTIAARLVRGGAEISIRGAVALGDREGAREMLRANPHEPREISMSGGLLTLAVNHGHLEMVRLLLDLGADVDERMQLAELEEPMESWGAPLWSAALANRRDIAELLLDRGADPNSNVYASGWPLGNAWNHEDGSVKRLLLERGARLQPYMVAFQHDVGGARKLLESDPSEHVVHELTWAAADQGCAAIVELAISRLDWPRSDPRWHWVLIQPIRGIEEGRESYFDCMAAILAHGVDPNVPRFGATTLHFAAAREGGIKGPERARFAAMLIDYGARLDVRDELLKSTPLGWACRWGRREMAEVLIARGASIDEPDAEPWATPRAWAQKMQRADTIAILERG